MKDVHPRDLQLPFSAKIALLAVIVVACAVTGMALGQSDWAALLYGYMGRLDDAQRLDPSEAVYAKTQGDRLIRMTPPRLDLAADQYRLALCLAPCSPLHWRDWTYANRRRNRIDLATMAAETAEFLAPNDHAIEMEMGDLLLGQARPDDAARHHYHAIQLKPSLAPSIYPAYWNIGWKPAAVLQKVIPNDPGLLRRYWTDCLSRFEPEDVLEVWQAITPAHGDALDSESYSTYFDYLIARKQYAQARDLWDSIIARFYTDPPAMNKQPSPHFWNGDFRYRGIFDGGLEWRISKYMPESSYAGVSPWRGIGQNNSLWLHFGGEANVAFSSVRHSLFVEPGTTYRLKYRVNALNVTTDNGPYVKITVYADKPSVTKGRVIRNSGDWQLEDEFSVPKPAQWAEISICRDPSSKLGNRIKGDVWFDEFTLEVVEPAPNHEEAQGRNE